MKAEISKNQHDNTPSLSVIVDLDGTLIVSNSMVKFTVWAFRKLCKSFHIMSALKVSLYVLSRKLRIISHSRMKYNILRIVNGKFTDSEIADFCNTMLYRDLNLEIDKMVKGYRREYPNIILATAAPELYAKSFGEITGFKHVIATKFTESYKDFSENKGEVKLENVIKKIQELNNGVTPTEGLIGVVFTDSRDDNPLLNYNLNGINHFVG